MSEPVERLTESRDGKPPTRRVSGEMLRQLAAVVAAVEAQHAAHPGYLSRAVLDAVASVDNEYRILLGLPAWHRVLPAPPKRTG